MSTVVNRFINGVRAKDRAEVVRHCITRKAFVRHVVADFRTRDLFAQWKRDSRLDLVINEWIAALDGASQRLGLPHRSALLDHPEAAASLPHLARTFLDECAKLCRIRLDGTLQERAAQIDRFVCTTLYSEPPAARAWLGVDLLRSFEADILNTIAGEPFIEIDIAAEALAGLPKGLRPKLGGQHLERNATWYYQLAIQVPRAAEAELAAEYQNRRLAEGADVEATKKDRDGRAERWDDSMVRRGAAEAQRLLELTVSPEQWNRFDRQFKRRRKR